jgi:hypothetical protein
MASEKWVTHCSIASVIVARLLQELFRHGTGACSICSYESDGVAQPRRVLVLLAQAREGRFEACCKEQHRRDRQDAEERAEREVGKFFEKGKLLSGGRKGTSCRNIAMPFNAVLADASA